MEILFLAEIKPLVVLISYRNKSKIILSGSYFKG